jgi:hypothetical protein
VTFHVWGAAAVIVTGSLLFGYGVNVLGFRCRAAAPAVGLSLLILISSLAIKLPGTAVTAAVLLLVLLLASAVLVGIRREKWRFPGVALAAICVAAFGAAIPFIANGRAGLPGVSLDNDTSSHLVYAEGLRSAVSRRLYGVPTGYPLGPHSLADTVSSGLGVRLDLAFTALLIATVIITALVGANALRGESGWKRVVAGTMAGLLYLVAAYYAEAAFKETMMGLLLLAFVLHLEEVRGEWSAGSPGRWRALAPASLMVAAGIYLYSYPAVAWFGLTVGIWLAAEALARPAWRRHWSAQLRDLGPPSTVAIGVLLLLLLPIAGRISSFVGTLGISPSGTGAIATSNFGNLPHALSPYEALGIWNSVDFRFIPLNVFHAGELSAFALAVLALGIGWSVARRELLLPAAVAACALIYWRASHGQSPYVSAKALVIAGPVIAVIGLRGLLGTPRAPMKPWVAAARRVAAVAFVVFAMHSSYVALANEPVWPQESTRELIRLDQLTRGQRVLFLGASDYAEWLFHDSEMSALAPDGMSLGQATDRPTKPNVYGTALDFDSVNPPDLNKFQWFITTNTAYASQPPPGVRLVSQLRMYQLWMRVGRIPPRRVIEQAGFPGAVLNCHSSAGRAISQQRGVAAVMTPPVIRSIAGIPPGGTERVSLSLPPGTWQLSLQYISAVDVEVTAGATHWTMPAYLDRPGPIFAIGSITSSGNPVVLAFHADRPSSLTGGDLLAQPDALIVTRMPDTRELTPLRRSCGRYIDWYRS